MRMKTGRKSHLLRQQASAHEVHNNWEISYGDMITLLLGFFILFFNIKQDRVNMKLYVDKLEKKFNNATGQSMTTGVQQKIETTKNLLATQSLQKYKLHTNMYGEKLYIEFPGISFFDAGKTALTPEGRHALDLFAESIDKNVGSVRFVIRGYTDNSPAKPNSTDHLEMSAWRSLSAIRHLNKKGIELKYMRIAGYGESDLSDRRLAASERRFDRKVVIVVEPLDAAERGHEELNKVVMEKEEKLNALKAARLNAELSGFTRPVYDMINEPSLEKWIHGLVDVQKKTAPKNERIPASVKPNAPSPKPVPRKPRAYVPQEPWVHEPSQQQVDQSLSGWVKNTYLYKKINPYYMNKTETQSRGSK